MAAPLTESQWATFIDYPRLVNDLKRQHNLGRTKLGRRKLRLFACACCRLLAWHLPIPTGVRECVEVAERFADDESAREDLRRLWTTHFGSPESDEQMWAEHAMIETTRLRPIEAARWAPFYLEQMLRKSGQARPREKIAEVLRHVFGKPYHAVCLELAHVKWKNGTAPKIAETIYVERRFADLPILADVLEEAGCTDRAIIDHCRSKEEHVRGCWVIDLLIGKDWRR